MYNLPPHMNLFLYVTTAARIIYEQKWQDEAVLTEDDWQLKLMEYAELASLSSKIGDQDDTVFKEDWKMFADYYYLNVNKLKRK